MGASEVQKILKEQQKQIGKVSRLIDGLKLEPDTVYGLVVNAGYMPNYQKAQALVLEGVLQGDLILDQELLIRARVPEDDRR